MNKIKSIIIAVLVLVIGSFSLPAQNLNELRHEAEEESYWDAVSNMYRCILFDLEGFGRFHLLRWNSKKPKSNF